MKERFKKKKKKRHSVAIHTGCRTVMQVVTWGIQVMSFNLVLQKQKCPPDFFTLKDFGNRV